MTGENRCALQLFYFITINGSVSSKTPRKLISSAEAVTLMPAQKKKFNLLEIERGSLWVQVKERVFIRLGTTRLRAALASYVIAFLSPLNTQMKGGE